MSPAAILALADAADALARLARAMAEEPNDPGALLPLAQAAREACTTRGVLREAIQRGELSAYGRQRDRAVRRQDLARKPPSPGGGGPRRLGHRAAHAATAEGPPCERVSLTLGCAEDGAPPCQIESALANVFDNAAPDLGEGVLPRLRVVPKEGS